MKNIFRYSILSIAAVLCLAGCKDWLTTERHIIQTPDKQSLIVRDDAYYQKLRAYKKTKHKLAFGWYGSWTATGASYQTRLQSAPDSMDIISIWSQWHSLTPEQIADKDFVQKVKGTKVIFTVFLNNLPDEFKIKGQTTDEAIETFAKAYCRDSINKYNYDGIDIDYEPGYGAFGEFVGHDNEQFKKLITAMSKYVGPKSGTGKLFTIDGVPFAVHKECAQLFDYGIVQAYQSNGDDDLQYRFSQAADKGWKPEQYIFTENFESYWKTGGVNFRTATGEYVNSLLGMARFNPSQGFCAGFGSYHMEYEYGDMEMPYRYMRRAIQDVNPSSGEIKVDFASQHHGTLTFLIGDNGSLTCKGEIVLSLRLSKPVAEKVSFPLKADNSLVKEYNKKYKKDFKTIDGTMITLSDIKVNQNQAFSEKVKVKLSSKGLQEGTYLIPIVVEIPAGSLYISKEKLVFNVFVNVSSMNIDIDAGSVNGIKVNPTSDWKFHCFKGKNSTSGASGVWNENFDKMFNDDFSTGWITNGSSWNEGGNFIIELDKDYKISGFRWYVLYRDWETNPVIADIQYSNDKSNWKTVLGGTTFTPKLNSDSWTVYKPFSFIKPINAKYLRVIVEAFPKESYTSMSEIEIYSPSK